MPTASDRMEFGPPPQPGLLLGVVLALLVHALLMAALTWGIRWNRDIPVVSAEAELWASIPQQAAPQEVAAPPPPAPPPPAVPEPVKREEPVKPPEPQQREPDINIEREKEKRELERRDQEKREQEKRAQDRREKEKREAQQRKLAAEAERERHAIEARAAEDKRKKEEERKRREKQQEAKVQQLRDENLKRMQGMAGGSSRTPSPGVAAQSSGPSANWAGRVIARVRPNIVFSDNVAGNPSAEVEVRLAPDGTIVGKRLVKPSGLRSWDEAVLRALDKTEVLPRDTDGSVPSPVILEFRLKD